MIIYKRLLGFLLSPVLSAFLLLSYYFPKKIWYLLFLSLFFLIFYFWNLKNRFVKYKLLLKYFLVILLFLIPVWLFFIVIDSLIIKYFISFLVFIYLLIILDSIFKKVYANQNIQNSLIIYLDLISFWLINYFLFFSLVLFRVNILWTVLILLFFIIFLLILRFYWQKINFQKNILYISIIVLILLEIYIITSFLAFNFYSSAFIMWLWYFLLSDFLVDKIKGDFFWKRKRKILIFVVLLFIFYLISVR